MSKNVGLTGAISPGTFLGSARMVGRQHPMRIVLLGFIVFLFAVTLASHSHAKYASFVIDTTTNKILHSVNADTRNYPASLTKMMTLYMVFEALEKGTIQLDDEMVVSSRASQRPPSKLGLRRGQTIKVEDAILALVTKSANDVATVVAETLGETERKFAQMMTAKARKIGMKRTTFRNASGLPHRGQLSTARDMATLGIRLMNDFPGKYEYFATRSFHWKGSTYSNHNKLLKNYKGVDGIKTGYTRASGFNLVTAVERKGHRLVGVVFGGKTAKRRDAHMRTLLTRSFKKIPGEPQIVQQSDEKSSPVKTAEYVSNGNQWAIQVGAYHNKGRAAKWAETALDRVVDVVKGGETVVSPLRNKRRTVYRARIVDLTKKEAYRACKSLKSRDMQCMVVKLRGPLEVAQR